MWKNYLTITLRNLWKAKFYSLINLFGLALGLTCFLFILLYVRDELSYDRFHEHAGRIYRVHADGKLFGQSIVIPQVGSPFGLTVLRDFPEVEQQVRLREYSANLVRYEDRSFREEDVIYADSTFFEVFSFPLLRGHPREVLREPNTVVITPSVARKYFGDEDPIGKALTFDNDRQFRVSGLMAEMPRNSHFRRNIIVSMASADESRNEQWTSFNFPTYLLLKPGADPAAVDAKFPAFLRTYFGQEVERFLGMTIDDFERAGNSMEFSLFPLTRIHLHSDLYDELEPNSDIRYVYIFSFIGAFILLLACINFMNLSTARSATRAREVGLRKVVGARRRQLVLQFIGESTLLTLLSLLLALGAIYLLLPAFNQLSGKELVLADLNRAWFWAAMGGLVFLVGLIAGSYPAFFLSGFRPILVLKGGPAFAGRGDGYLRNALVVFQFAITIVLLTGTLVINRQLQFIQNKKLGFDREQVLVLNNAHALGNNAEAFKAELARRPQVLSASFTSYLPTPSNRNTSSYFLGGNPEEGKTQLVGAWYVDHDFVRTMSIEVAEGRDFRGDTPADSSAILINEAAVKAFRIEDDPLGVTIGTFTGQGENVVTYRVIGVVRDFHYASLRERIAPLVLHLGRSRGMLAVKLRTDDIGGFVRHLEGQWKSSAPGQPFEYNFLDERFNEMYGAETRVGHIIGMFTLLAVVIACLGLLGLATFTAQRRTKEIGVRKVLGASAGSLFLLLTTQFARWVLLASIIGLPVAYFAMNRWLQGFEYRVGITAFTLLLAAAGALLIAVITVGWQAWWTARSNPVRALKYE